MENEVKADNSCQNDDPDKTLEKYIYHFDYPQLNESGYVTIDQLNNIIVVFPEKPNVSVQYEIKLYHNSVIYINKKLHFSYEWLPIYNYNDLYKVKDMISKVYYDYLSIINVHVSPLKNKKYFPLYCSEILTEHKTKYYEILCFENTTNTCFEISIFNTDKLENICSKTDFKNLQIFIGGNLIFCGKRDLLNYNIPFNECQNIIQLILSKLI
jgi:hypothetical protein